MLSKRGESTDVDRKTFLDVPSGNLWSISSDPYTVINTLKENFTKMYK